MPYQVTLLHVPILPWCVHDTFKIVYINNAMIIKKAHKELSFLFCDITFLSPFCHCTPCSALMKSDYSSIYIKELPNPPEGFALFEWKPVVIKQLPLLRNLLSFSWDTDIHDCIWCNIALMAGNTEGTIFSPIPADKLNCYSKTSHHCLNRWRTFCLLTTPTRRWPLCLCLREGENIDGEKQSSTLPV